MRRTSPGRRFRGLALVLALPAAAADREAAAPARPPVHDLFGDRMVLQRDRPAAIWGWAAPGARVAVEVEGATPSEAKGRERPRDPLVFFHLATADSTGRWETRIGPFAAGGPATIRVLGAPNVELRDVLFGDVWLCAGGHLLHAALPREEAARLQAPWLRVAWIPPDAEERPSPETLGLGRAGRDLWRSARAASADPQPRVPEMAWAFAKALNDRHKVPVGLVVVTRPDDGIESWLPAPAASNGTPARAAASGARRGGDPGSAYASRLRPLAPFTFRGALWQHGDVDAEDEAAARRYRTALPALLREWRAAWDEEDWPFVVVQLPWTARAGYGFVAEAQVAAQALPHTELAVTVDVAAGDSSPASRRAVGERAALAARRVAYGEPRVAAVGPVFRGAQPEGAALRVAFDYVGGGLETRDRRPPVGLQIAGEDRRFVPAEARLDGATLVVSAREVPAPVAVRYLWDAPAGRTPNLVNREGLPASPFRSDAWE